MSDTYCPYPFNGVSLQANNTVLPCGQYMDVNPFQKIIPIQEVRKSAYMEDMRQRMLNGQHGLGCQCPAEEAAGIRSMRQKTIEEFGVDTSDDLKIVEIFFDNVCNLKCRSCASPYSHLWYEDEKLLYGQTLSDKKYHKNTIYKEIDISKLEMVDIYGGEPTLSQDVDDFLGSLLLDGRLDKITLSMSTNCTKAPSGNILAAIEKAKKIKVALSIDAFGPLNDIVRSGANWNDTVGVLDFWHDVVRHRPKNSSTVMVHSAVSVYNANKIHELDDFVKEYYPLFVRTHQVVQFPVFLSLRNTPKDFKQSVREFIKDEKILNYMDQPGQDLFGHFINFHKKLNEIRDEDLGNLNPWLSNYIKDYKNVPDWFDSQIFFSKAISDLKTNTSV